MSEPGSSRRGRTHDAEGAKEAILNAAEEVFAEHGFDGARIDAIAAKAGYNKSLIFQYFGDKLNLYAEITKRADREMAELQGNLLTPLLEDEAITSDRGKFKALLETIAGTLFDYLAAHPRLIRLINWEQAEDWQTYKKIFSQFDTEDADRFEAIFSKAHRAGLLRSDFPGLIQTTVILQICLSYLAYIPLYELVLPGEDFSSRPALQRARAYLIDFIVAGMMTESDKET
jgi:AcrR family transcriptional regulator